MWSEDDSYSYSYSYTYSEYSYSSEDEPKRQPVSLPSPIRVSATTSPNRSPKHPAYGLDANALSLMSAQTAAAVSAAVAAALASQPHGHGQTTVPITNTIPSLPTPPVKTDEVKQGQASPVVQPVQAEVKSLSPPMRTPTKEVSPPTRRQSQQSPLQSDELVRVQEALQAVQAEYADYRRRMDIDLKMAQGRQTELEQELKTVRTQLRKQEEEYGVVLNKLSRQEDELVELRRLLKQAQAQAQIQTQVQAQGLVKVEAQPTVRPTNTYKPKDSVGSALYSIPEERSASSVKMEQPSPKRRHRHGTHHKSESQPVAKEGDVLSFEAFVRQRAQAAAIEELQQRDDRRRDELDGRIRAMQEQLAQVLESTDAVEPETKAVPTATATTTTTSVVPLTTPPLGELQKDDPRYKLLMTMETDQCAMLQQIEQYRRELDGLENRAKRTHRDLLRIRFLTDEIATLEKNCSDMKRRIRMMQNDGK